MLKHMFIGTISCFTMLKIQKYVPICLDEEDFVPSNNKEWLNKIARKMCKD
jgi:hypothetical protein